MVLEGGLHLIVSLQGKDTLMVHTSLRLFDDRGRVPGAVYKRN